VKDLPINQKLKKSMGTLALRQKVLSGNVAHINTPGKKAQDIDPKALEGKENSFQHQVKLARTSPSHIAHVTSTGPQPKVKTDKSKENMDMQGNNISMEDQLQKIEETRLSHQMAATLFRKNHDLIRMIVKR
jgi:flagellar basal-body rod protein FlgB